jgi:hypothetical protein
MSSLKNPGDPGNVNNPNQSQEHQVLPVEPQTYEHHVYCSALRTTPRGAVGKGCSCDVIEKSLANQNWREAKSWRNWRA